MIASSFVSREDFVLDLKSNRLLRPTTCASANGRGRKLAHRNQDQAISELECYGSFVPDSCASEKGTSRCANETASVIEKGVLAGKNRF